MGTNGIIKVVAKQKKYSTYNHFDSYPAGLGNEIIADLLELLKRMGSYEAVAALWANLKIVRENSKVGPTDADVAKLKPYLDLQFETFAGSPFPSTDPMEKLYVDTTRRRQFEFNYKGYSECWFQLCKGLQGSILKNIESGYWLHVGGSQEYVWKVDIDAEKLSYWHYGEFKRKIPFADMKLNIFTRDHDEEDDEDDEDDV